MPRLHLPLSGEPSEVVVEGDRHHYLTRVLRLSAGAELEVFDGRGRAFPAKLSRVSAESSTLSLGPPREISAGISVLILQGLPKSDKLELVLQKGTELGASAFVPVSTVRSVVKLDGARAEERRRRWQKIAEEAARQCGRADVPQVHPVSPLLDAARALEPGTQLLVLDEEERAVRLSAVLHSEASIALVIGPEGGLAREEVAELVSLGATPVSLGPRILRTETAALAALAIIRHREGSLG